MRKALGAAALVVAVLIPADARLMAPLHAQTGAPPTTYEGSDAGGWSGPCERWWDTSNFPFDAMRVCRVTTYLIHGFQRSPDWTTARSAANQLFRICWGRFPRSGSPSCDVANAWATLRGWTAKTGYRPPIVITLQATEDLQSDDEVAFVLSHEMGHAVDAGQTVGQQTRENEDRADLFGVGFVIKAGYDVRSAGRGLQMIEGERGRGVIGNLMGMLGHAGDGSDAHGFARDRIANMKQVFATGCSKMGNKPIGCKDGWK